MWEVPGRRDAAVHAGAMSREAPAKGEAKAATAMKEDKSGKANEKVRPKHGFGSRELFSSAFLIKLLRKVCLASHLGILVSCAFLWGALDYVQGAAGLN